MRCILVTGTGTEVGKTWVGAALARELTSRAVRVAARKPAQSYAPGEGPTDAEVLARATGERADLVCPLHRRYELPVAPPMARAALGRPPFTIADLVGELTWPDDATVGIVEGAGGPRSPLADDGDTVDLAIALRPQTTVLVADAGLGTINAVRLAVASLAAVAPVVVMLNRFSAADDLHRWNRAWLEDRAALCVVTDPVALADRVLA